MQEKKVMTGQQAFQKLAALCAKGEHCQQEMLEKMRQWGVGDEEQAEVMARLVGERYVDDERFTRAFVSDKIRYNKWGRHKVEQALWLKHIDKTIVAQVLDDIPAEEYISILKPLLKQKRRSIKASTKQSGAKGSTSTSWGRQENAKLIKFAISRGFTMDIIKQCIEVEDEDEFLD